MAVLDTRLLFSCCLIATICAYEHTIFVSKKLQLDECETVNKTFTQCSSLYEAFHSLMTFCNSTDVNIEPDTYVLNSSWQFTDLKDIQIRSSKQGDIPVVQCLPNVNKSANFDSGIAFVRVTDLVIHHLNITGCGMKHVSTSQIKVGHFITFRSALFVQNSTNVTIDHVNMFSNNGIGTLIVDTNGVVCVSSSTFVGNTINKEEQTVNLTGGGGMSIEFTECSPGVTTCNSYDNQYNANSNYTIYQCIFENNSAVYNYTEESERPTSNTHVYYGFGGGLSIGIHGQAHHNSFNITASSFSFNEANSGSGFNVEIKQNAKYNYVIISYLFISGNLACVFGGGAVIGISVVNYNQQVSNNTVIVTDCIFELNVALNGSGGGISWYASHEIDTAEPTNHFEVYNSQFIKNKAPYGSAIQINKEYFSLIIGGKVLTLLLENCSFIRNDLSSVDTSESSGIGAVAASGVSIQFRKSTVFIENKSTALVVDDSVVEFYNHSYTNFQENRGLHGGAILLMGSSLMEIYYNATLIFLQKTAAGYGGAIYVELSAPYDYLISHACFVRYFDDKKPKEWTANITFVNNSAVINNTIFANTLRPCMKFYLQNISFLYEKPFYYSTSDHYNLIVTSPMLFKFDSNNTGLVNIVPGEIHNLNVYLVDELHQNISNVMFIASCREHYSPHVVPIYRITDGPIQIAGKPKETCQLQLTTDTNYQISKMMQVTLVDCPPGFVYNKYKLQCECLVNHMHRNPAITGCDLVSFQAYFNYFYWIGHLPGNSTDLFIGTCPYRYCYTDRVSQTMLLPKHANRSTLDEFVCGTRKRTGVLCGKCVDGYSVIMNSPTFMCSRCKNHQLGVLYLLISYLVPVTVLFYVIMVFNIRLTTGPISAFLFFSQIISSQYHLDFNYGLNVASATTLNISSALLAVYGVSNLNFFQHDIFSYCLFTNAGTIDILAFNVLLSLYPLLLMVAYFVVRQYCVTKCRCQLKCFTLLFNSSVTHGIGAFLVLCFAKLNSVFAILKSAGVYHIDNPNAINKAMVYLQGDIHFFQDNTYNIYAIGSILVSITLIAIPTIVLMLYPFISNIVIIFRWEESNGIQFVNKCLLVHKLKPILDSFQGDYKNHLQFFAGVYFFLYKTLFFCIVIAGSSPDVNALLFFVILFFLLITLVHMLTMPYKKYTDNAAYSLVYMLLLIILFIEYFIFTSGESYYAVTLLWLKLLLSALPLCCVVGYCVWWIVTMTRSCYIAKTMDYNYELLADFPDRLINDEENDDD
ncbi:uncharacterized protein [Dysidea avara]|uniref:uncharacterized protein isoform X1 n=1 Tax=Dysidea avara TaxID=196820 RepID=UPI00332EE10C